MICLDLLKKSKFLPLLIHEVRSPINLIISHVHKSLKLIDQNENVKKELELINNLSHHVLMLINDILDFSKLYNDQLFLVYEEFNLEELIDSFYAMYEVHCSLKNISFEIKKTNLKFANLMGDPVRLLTILHNLLSNAVKFTNQDGSICFEISQKIINYKIQTIFKVSDSGIGMSEEFIKDLFKPYTQEICRYGGTGLGMMMVKELVNLMQGTITVNSQKNIGTSFTVTIDYDLPPTNEDLAYDFSGKRILIVDDNQINLEMTADFLELTNITIDTANNGQEAYEKVLSANNPFDIVLMDLEMPILDGFQSAKKIRQINNYQTDKVKIIALTAGDSQEEQKLVYASGMNDLLTKPVNVKNLYKTLQKYMDKTA